MPQPDHIVGADSGLKGVLHRARMVARSDAVVLLLGETGTGKEVVARVVHEKSSHRTGPFWRVNCGALSPELIDSELFGHEQGAFTGATARRRGWFEQANGGTLFLDEVGELTLPAQVRLLRVVQDGELVRVGGERSVKVDVRIVAATHRDLPALVAAGAFREDLYYRLAVFPIVIPPLRDRRDDIPKLAAYFAERAARRFGVRASLLLDADAALLREYPWPGNVRELAAVMDRAVLLGDGARLDVRAALGPANVSSKPPGARASRHGDATQIEPLDSVVIRHIERALATTNGRVEGPRGAARLLRLNPHTLRSRMRKLGIDWRRFRSAES
jgi:transcriptional regulator with GAF, ATPase, and Fis domain